MRVGASGGGGGVCAGGGGVSTGEQGKRFLARPSPVDYFELEVLPAVYDRLGSIFPELQLARRGRGDGWVGPRVPAEAYPLGVRGDRVYVGRIKRGLPAGFAVAGGDPISFLGYLTGDLHGTPSGDRWKRAAARLAELAGVDPGPLGDAEAVWDAEAARKVQERLEAQRRHADKLQRRRQHAKRDLARRLWAKAHEGHPAIAEYIDGRGIELSALEAAGGIPRSLRYHPAAPVGRGKHTCPAVLAAVVLAGGDGGRAVVAVHRLYLDDTGRAIHPEHGKRMLGPVRGGAVLLGDPAGGDPLVLCEGIETGLAIRAATGWPVWACLSAGGLKAIEIGSIGSVTRVVVAGDLDDPDVRDEAGRVPLRGQRAAEQAAERLTRLHGIEASVAVPWAFGPEAWRPGATGGGDRG